MRVSEVMSKNPAYVKATSTVREAHQSMQQLDVRHLPIVQDGKVVGILSDRDVRTFLLDQLQALTNPATAHQRLDEPVTKLTHFDPLVVHPDTEVPEAIDMMLGYKIGALPVIQKESGSLVGMLSYVDLLFKSRDFFSE